MPISAPEIRHTPLKLRRQPAARAAVVIALALAAVVGSHAGRAAATDDSLSIGGPVPNIPAVQPGFLGLSLEYNAVLPYAGTHPGEINPVLLQLIRNLNPNQRPSIRIGGDSTDATWWPIPHTKKPGGIKFTLNRTWLSVASSLAHQLNAKLILGTNLEAGRADLARAETAAFTQGIGNPYIDAFEPGNEPELYASWTYYRTRKGHKVFGRPARYSFADFEREFARMRQRLGNPPLAGPTTGSVNWMRPLASFLNSEPQLHLVTLHRYPLQLCFISPTRPQFPTIAHLLSPNSSRGLANSVKSSVDISHARHVPIRIDEMNSNGCGHAPQVTETFASALWVLDAVSAMANVGVDGVNIHTYPGSSYDLFTFHRAGGRWYGSVPPEYYGLMMFAVAAPPGSRPLSLAGPATADLSTWAYLGPDNSTRVLLINDDPVRTRNISIPAGLRMTPAAVIRLQARSLTAHDGVTLAGGSFSPASGQLMNATRTESAMPSDGRYTITAPAASATLVALPPNLAPASR